MRIEDIRFEESDGRARVVARVIWEDCERPTRDVYFETAAEFAGALSCSAEPFVVAATMPALWHGERRLRVAGEICPTLRDGLTTAMNLMRHWHDLDREPVRFEAPLRAKSPVATSPRAGFFVTGGVDCLATLRANRLNYPRTHPGWIRDGIAIFGLEVDDSTAFEHVLERLRSLAGAAEFTLMPVYTSVRYLHDDWLFWREVFEGAVLASVGHAARRQLTQLYIASSNDFANLHPHGSHPMLDPLYSSHELRIFHDGTALTRLDKVRLLADWDIGLQHLRVCNQVVLYRADQLNCGRCEKCLRTMLALLIAGALNRTDAFPQIELTEQLITDKVQLTWMNYRFWPELARGLEQIRRRDLARAIRRALAAYRHELGWKGALRRFDRKRFNGALFALKRAVRPGPRPAKRRVVGGSAGAMQQPEAT